MKVVLAGGGTGGHFYPLIAVAQSLHRLAEEQKLVDIELFYLSDEPYDEEALFENRIAFRKVSAGKKRTYRSIKNFFDIFKSAAGIVGAIRTLFFLYPDVVFSKGGYAAFPTLMAARFLRIPVVIHESDSVPGRVSVWSGKFATRIYVAFPEAASMFPKDKAVLVGIPMREELITTVKEGAYSFLGLEENLPTLFVGGGSTGSQTINDAFLDILPNLVTTMQIVHQTGEANIKEVSGRSEVVLRSNIHKARYKVFDFLNPAGLKMVAGITTLAVSRAGATSIFELAQWGIPSIVIPITDSQGDHQRKNAYSYARAGGAVVIEEHNLTPHILEAEIHRIIETPGLLETMRTAAKAFATKDAGRAIAQDIITLGIAHES